MHSFPDRFNFSKKGIQYIQYIDSHMIMGIANVLELTFGVGKFRVKSTSFGLSFGLYFL